MLDTIHANLNYNFEVLIKTQSINRSFPSFYKKVDNDDSIDISNHSCPVKKLNYLYNPYE